MRMPLDSPDGARFASYQRDEGTAETPSWNTKYRVMGSGDVYADGDFYPGGADFAEMIRVGTGADTAEAGDLMVIDVHNPRSVVKSSTPRFMLVAGIYSTDPGVVGSNHDWDLLEHQVPADRPIQNREAEGGSPIALARMIDEIPLAIVGIVPCKVTTEMGAIRPGDLLVTSSTPGHAMRDDDPKPGTIVGKSLGSLESGTGVVQVLVTLQ
jgi:hypothetical protein